MLALEMRIYSNMIDMWGGIWSITQISHLFLCDFCLWETLDGYWKLHPAGPSCIGARRIHRLQTPISVSIPYTCHERHPSPAEVPAFPLISGNTASSTSQQLSSCNSSGSYFHKQTAGVFFKVKCQTNCSISVFLNCLKCIRLHCCFVLSFKKICYWWSFWVLGL